MTYGSPAGRMALVRDEAYAVLPARSTVSESILALASERVPVDVFVEVAQALIMAWEELEQLAVTPVPLPEELLERQHEHEAMLDTLREAPEEWKPRLREIYEATLARSGSLNGPQWESAPATLLPGVLEGLEAVEESLRRAALADPGVAEAMRQVHGS